MKIDDYGFDLNMAIKYDQEESDCSGDESGSSSSSSSSSRSASTSTTTSTSIIFKDG